jgi:hypothetical protein
MELHPAPLQHGSDMLQGWPLGTHACPPQTPLAQSREQHWPLAPQIAPLGRQGPQKPLLHCPSQQSDGWRHLPSLGTHIWGWQVPSTPQRPEQHCAGLVQGNVSGSQGPPLQTPLVQALVQQSAAVAHFMPGWAHIAEHTPRMQKSMPGQQSAGVLQKPPWPWHGSPQTKLLQIMEQQSEACMQPLPSPRHVSGPQTLSLLQSLLQQSALVMHGDPSDWHCWTQVLSAPQMPLQQSSSATQGSPLAAQAAAQRVPMQMLEQHWEASVQGSPSAVQEPPQVPFSHEPAQQSVGEVHAAPVGRHVDMPPVPAPAVPLCVGMPRRSLRPQLAERSGPPIRVASTRTAACQAKPGPREHMNRHAWR